MRIAVFYILFGILAAAANLGAQALVHAVLPPLAGLGGIAYWVALVFGTGVGLVVKYLLDKRWIFFDTSRGLAAHGRQFSLYTLMGVATTVIFWGVQSIAFAIFGTRLMLYVGGAVGLAIGYVVKYRLDKRFVFGPAQAGSQFRVGAG
ncbi:GtrA family protein [Seohaeicola saemankumensis]|uniref:GtrA family protein n=1 Tax=Seohaeicola saemankumensis TaxID=481181 RepID=A0ABW3TH66_9RHOB